MGQNADKSTPAVRPHIGSPSMGPDRRSQVIVGLFLLLLMATAIFPSQRVPMPDLLKPDSITVDGGEIFITDQTTVLIYSLKDFRLLKKFGKRGEGPKEFLVRLDAGLGLGICVQPDFILINSWNKVSLFTRNGDYIKETGSRTVQTFKPLGDKYVGYTQETVDNILNLSIRLYDKDFTDEKEIYRKEWYAQLRKDFNPLHLAVGMTRRALYHTYDNKLFVEGENGEIVVFDHTGKKILTITHDYKKVPFTQKHIDEILKSFERRGPGLFRLAKQRGQYPEYFRPRYFTVADDRVYVLTYEQEDGKSAFYVFDFKGKFLKKVFVPFYESDFLHFYPYSVSGGKLYQLVDNEDTEEWELVVSKLKE
jgi:hypothetical protein